LVRSVEIKTCFYFFLAANYKFMKKTKSFSNLIKTPKKDKNIKNKQQKKKSQKFSSRFGQILNK